MTNDPSSINDLPYWINEWHILFAPLALLASVGLAVWWVVR